MALVLAGCGSDLSRLVIIDSAQAPPPAPPGGGNFPPVPPPPGAPAPPPAPPAPPPGPSNWTAVFTPQGMGVNDLIAHPDEPSVAFALTAGTLYRTLDAGAVWTQTATKLAPAGGACASIAVAGSTVYLAISRDPFGNAGNVAVSTDDGASFAPVATLTVAFTRLVVSKAASDTLFAISFGTTSTPAAVFRSTDSGRTWSSRLAFALGVQLLDIDVAPSDSATVAVAVSDGVSSRGVVTHDGGATWSTFLSAQPVTAVAIDPVSSSTLYAGTRTKAVHRSTDGGATFTKTPTIFEPRSLRIAASAPAVLYAATDGAGVFTSPDAGASWWPANLGISQLSITSVAVDRSDPLLVHATEALRLYRTTTGGR